MDSKIGRQTIIKTFQKVKMADKSIWLRMERSKARN